MERVPEKLFKLCDTQGKGFIVKEDLLVLQNELSLTNTELETVFEKLDANKLGYLTLPGFIEAYNRYVSINEGQNCIEQEFGCERRYSLTGVDAIKITLTKSAGYMSTMDRMLSRQNDPAMLQCWNALLENLDYELAEQLEKARNKIVAMNREKNDYADLLEEFELEMVEEKKKIMMHERIKLLKIKEEFKQQLQLKESQIAEMSEYRNELFDRLSVMMKIKNGYKKNKSELLKEKESLLEMIENQKEVISQLENQFETFRQEMIKECKRHYQEGYERGRKRAKIEENGLLEELNILKNVYKILVKGNTDNEMENSTTGVDMFI